MVSCVAKLFRWNGRDETFEAKKRGISMYGKYGGGRLASSRAAGNVFPAFALRVASIHAVVPDLR
jgi:hypothetical protein